MSYLAALDAGIIVGGVAGPSLAEVLTSGNDADAQSLLNVGSLSINEPLYANYAVIPAITSATQVGYQVAVALSLNNFPIAFGPTTLSTFTILINCI
jgi:hypothetical protein